MKKKLLNNPGLKIAAVLIAVFIWLVIVNVNDSVQTRTIYNVPIQVLNSSYIESLGKSYSIGEGYETISVRVKGNRSVVEPLTADDVTATIDLTEIVSLDASQVMVPVRVSVGDISENNISTNPETVEIKLDELVSQSFVVTASAGTTKPASGFQVGKLTPETEKLTVTGPSDLVSIIDRIEAPVDVSGLSADTIQTSHLRIYDKNGEELSDNKLKSLRFSIDSENVMVEIRLYRIVQDIAVEANGYTGVPGSGYQVKGMTVTPSTISVAGTEEALQALETSGNKLVIDSSEIDVSGASSNFDVHIEDISAALPDGIVLADGVADSVIVSVEVLPYNSTAVKFPTNAIEKLNTGKNLDYVFAEATVDILVKGADSLLSQIDDSQISASVDLTGLKAGTYDLPLEVTLPDGLTLVEDVTVSVTVTERTK